MPKIEILTSQRLYQGFFSLDLHQIRHRRLDGTLSPPLERLVFERGDAVAVMLYHRHRDSVLLVEQLRLPTFLRGDDGWLIETVAGMSEKGQPHLATAHKELLEETGYCVDELVHLYDFYLSPGACTERMSLYLGYLDGAQRVGAGGGVEGENEDIRLIEIPFPRAWEMCRSGEIRDAKTLIGLQHLALERIASSS